jgi:hypothetical protein
MCGRRHRWFPSRGGRIGNRCRRRFAGVRRGNSGARRRGRGRGRAPKLVWVGSRVGLTGEYVGPSVFLGRRHRYVYRHRFTRADTRRRVRRGRPLLRRPRAERGELGLLCCVSRGGGSGEGGRGLGVPSASTQTRVLVHVLLSAKQQLLANAALDLFLRENKDGTRAEGEGAVGAWVSGTSRERTAAWSEATWHESGASRGQQRDVNRGAAAHGRQVAPPVASDP